MSNKRKAPIWFLIVTIFLIAWNLIGLLSFYSHLTFTSDPDLMETVAMKQLYTQYPLWSKLVFGIAVISGMAGAILLAMKKRVSKFVFVISLIAVIIQMTHNLLMTDALNVLGIQAAILPTAVVIIGIFSIWLSSYADRKRWLHK
jgi:hypothetical protein